MARGAASIRTATLVLLIAGCAGQAPAAGSPAAPTSAPTVEPTGIWTLIGGNMPPGVFYQAEKKELIVGGHGGAPAIALPASIAVDYRVSGTCDFAISIVDSASNDPDPAAHFERKVVAESVQSTWVVTLEPGSYYVGPSDANGCTWIVTVRAGA